MGIMEEFSNAEDLVTELLRQDERCRNDDKWLCYCAMRQFTRAYIPFEDFDKFPSFETVTRCRRKIQHDKKLYPPTDPLVTVRRGVREGGVRSWATLV